ncbi:unnamed protein product, partial [Urochloa humidicola]
QADTLAHWLLCDSYHKLRKHDPSLEKIDIEAMDKDQICFHIRCTPLVEPFTVPHKYMLHDFTREALNIGALDTKFCSYFLHMHAMIWVVEKKHQSMQKMFITRYLSMKRSGATPMMKLHGWK